MLEAGPVDAKVLSVFDFDGTLTHHDSFVPFLKFAFGAGEFYGRMVKLTLPGLRFLVRQISRDELKAQLIRTFMTGVEKTWVQQKAEEYCQRNWARLMRPAGVLSVEQELGSGAVVTLCSASPALVLQPFADRLGIKLIGTELEVLDGVLTGRLTGNNCRCENKVLRLEAVYGDLGEYRLRAWGPQALSRYSPRSPYTASSRSTLFSHRQLFPVSLPVNTPSSTSSSVPINLIPSRSANGCNTNAGDAEHKVTTAPEPNSCSTESTPAGRINRAQLRWQYSSAFCCTHVFSTPVIKVRINCAFNSSRLIWRTRKRSPGSVSLTIRP